MAKNKTGNVTGSWEGVGFAELSFPTLLCKLTNVAYVRICGGKIQMRSFKN
jgi:hypothetical protein